MSHFVRIWKDSVLIARGFITGAELRDFDENTYRAINGDDGGIWSPSSPIIIGGQGMVATGRGWIVFGSGASATTGVNAPIEFGKGDASDYFGYADGNTASSVTCVTELTHPLVNSPYSFTGFNDSNIPRWEVVRSYFTQQVSPSVAATNNDPIRYLCPINVYSGAKMTSATLRFAVRVSHTNVPQNLPKMRIIAVSKDGETILPLRDVIDATTDKDGFQAIATPATGTIWYNGGAEQTFVYVCTSTHVIDASEYNYYVEIVEENGENATLTSNGGNVFYSISAIFGSISIFDGRN